MLHILFGAILAALISAGSMLYVTGSMLNMLIAYALGGMLGLLFMAVVSARQPRKRNRW